MPFKSRLGLHLAIQRWITIPNYCLCNNKYSKIILFLRCSPLIITNFFTFFDSYISFISLSINLFDDHSTLSLAVTFIGTLLVKLDVLVLTLFAIFNNSSHLNFLKILEEFNDNFLQHFPPKCNSKFCKRVNIEPILVCLNAVSCYIIYSFLTTRNISSQYTAIMTQAISDITFLYVLNFVRVFQNYLEVLTQHIEECSFHKTLLIFELLQKFLIILKHFNSTFGFLITYILFHHFVEGSLGMYFGTYKIYHSPDALDILSFSVWFARDIFFIYTISSACGDLYEEVRIL